MIIDVKDYYTIKVINYFKSVEDKIVDFLYSVQFNNPFYGYEYIKANCQIQKYLIICGMFNDNINVTMPVELHDVHYVNRNTLEMSKSKVLRIKNSNNISTFIDVEKDLYVTSYKSNFVDGGIDAAEQRYLNFLKQYYTEEEVPVVLNYCDLDNAKYASEVYTGVYGFNLFNEFENYLLKTGGGVLYKINDELFLKANSLNFIVYQVGKKTDENGELGQVNIDDILNNAGDLDYEFNASSIGYYHSYKSFMEYLVSLETLGIDDFKVYEELSNVSNSSLDNFIGKVANIIKAKTPVEILNLSNLGVYTSEFSDKYSYYTLKKNNRDLGFVRTLEQVADTVLTDVLLTAFSNNTPIGDIVKVLSSIS